MPECGRPLADIGSDQAIGESEGVMFMMTARRVAVLVFDRANILEYFMAYE